MLEVILEVWNQDWLLKYFFLLHTRFNLVKQIEQEIQATTTLDTIQFIISLWKIYVIESLVCYLVVINVTDLLRHAVCYVS